MAKLHVGISPITNRIFCGHVLKSGDTWGANKTDVTGAACAAVAQHVIANGAAVVVSANGAPAYEINARDLKATEPNPRERNEGGGDAVAAWRGVNELGEVVTEWQDGAPPAILYDLCGSSPTNYASVQVAYTHPAPTASEIIPTPSDATLGAQSEGGLREALDLLDILFTAYEDGPACYEDPDEQAGYLGPAVRIDEETFHRCADLLNRERPRNTPPAPDAAGREVPRCPTCNGSGEYCLGGRSAHPSNWRKCEDCTPPPAAPDHSAGAGKMVAQPWAPITEAELSAMLDAFTATTRGDDMRAAGNALLALRGGVAQGVVVDGFVMASEGEAARALCPCGAMVDWDECPYPTDRTGSDFTICCVDPECEWCVHGATPKDAIAAWHKRTPSAEAHKS